MNAIRKKLLDFKQRLSDRKMYSIVIVVLAVVTAWGIYQYKRTANLRQELDNQYNRAFLDLTGYVDNVEILLSKSLITSTKDRTAMILQEAWRQSNLAQTNLGQLPISPPVLSKTSNFLTQLGDFSYTLNNQNMSGKQLTDSQYSNLQKLHNLAKNLSQSLNNLEQNILTGRIKWQELKKKGTPLFKKASAKITAANFENIDKTFQEYPVLIYDGPFSDHVQNVQPKGLTGDNITAEQGKLKIKNFFQKSKIKNIKYTGKSDTLPIKTYGYNLTLQGNSGEYTSNVELTQKGGHILWMLSGKSIQKSTIDISKAKSLGKEFLNSLGYTNMVDTYYLKEDNTATINYAYTQNNVTVYPDLIKVKIALDNGEIIGLESKGYLFDHTQRAIPTPKISIDQARSLISSRVKISSSGLAIIPTDYKTEIFTYEFKGTLEDKDFLVYINAETGKEENILMIINTPNGVLSM